MEESSMRATVCASLAEWRAVAQALTRLAGLAGVRPGLAVEIHAAVAAHEHRRADATLALRPEDAAVVRAVRAGLRRRETEQTVADVEAFLGLPPRHGCEEPDHGGPATP